MFSRINPEPATHAMCICSSAVAHATIANQPTFDAGGFPIRIRKCIAGTLEPWETLSDSVTIIAIPHASEGEPVISMSGMMQENNTDVLPMDPTENSAGRAVLGVLSLLQSKGLSWKWQLHIVVKKGISLKGTGLGSSGASAAAGLKAMEDVLSQLNVSVDLTIGEKIDILSKADCGVPDNSIPAYFGGWTVLDLQRPDSFIRWNTERDIGHLVVVCPRGFGMKTSNARAVLPGKPDQQLLVRDMQAAIERGDIARYADLMQSAHEWFVHPRSSMYPDNGSLYEKIRGAALSLGALGFTISGAGPSVLAFATKESQAIEIGKALHASFRESGFDSVALLVDISPDGAIILPPFFHAVP